VFEYHQEAYPDDTLKVLYTIQFLKDTAQCHFRNSFSLPEAEKPELLKKLGHLHK
jgi:hypothetical protein